MVVILLSSHWLTDSKIREQKWPHLCGLCGGQGTRPSSPPPAWTEFMRMWRPTGRPVLKVTRSSQEGKEHTLMQHSRNWNWTQHVAHHLGTGWQTRLKSRGVNRHSAEGPHPFSRNCGNGQTEGQPVHQGVCHSFSAWQDQGDRPSNHQGGHASHKKLPMLRTKQVSAPLLKIRAATCHRQAQAGQC